MTFVDHGPATDDVGALKGSDRSVPEMVAAQAVESPLALAVAAEGKTLTYEELDQLANRVARHLRRSGVTTDVPVGLCLPRTADMVVGALGILKAGGAYVPMDPAYPAERLAFMLEDSQAPVLLTTEQLARRLPPSKRQVLSVGAPQIAAESTSPVTVEVAPGDLAYVIYTSGSTGKPKGVEITHGSLANLVSWHNRAFSVTAADRASHVAGLGFDAAVWELWPYLVAGASVHLADDASRNSGELLRDWLVARRITIGFVPTPIAERLLASGAVWPANAELRVMLTGGDTLHHYPPASLPFPLINNYGPTECTVVATSTPVPPATSADTLPPIGTAIANTEIHLLDESLRPVPPGAPGEIHIGGAGLARGYRNRPDLTAQRFIPNPLGSGRVYKTGDLARQLPDGQLLFLGRIDEQIKIRGYRIEPSEVETALNRHPSVATSVVVAREDTPGDRRLVAYVVLDADAEVADPVTHTGLREFLRESLPEHMLPAAFVGLETVPLTLNGKVDRAALPTPGAANTIQDETSESEAPATETEQRVAEILGELLKLEEIGLDDNFFLLGGHSLLGAQLIARLRETFGVEIGLRSLFEAPTVAALSAEVDRLTGALAGDTGR